MRNIDYTCQNDAQQLLATHRMAELCHVPGCKTISDDELIARMGATGYESHIAEWSAYWQLAATSFFATDAVREIARRVQS